MTIPFPPPSAARRPLLHKTVTLAHGGGGSAMRDLIDDVFLSAFAGEGRAAPEDQARFDLSALMAHGDRLAFTTDGFVVDPLEFPGGDIGKLAVCGTVNDLAVGGARPVALSCAVIIEEGLEVETLRRVVRSMAETAREAGVAIATGDTKVVARGACDKLFITTTGIGVVKPGRDLSITRARPGDVLLVNGLVGDHGAAILNARGDLALDADILSDCAPLNGLIEALIAAAPGIRMMRDATRGGVGTVLYEIAEQSHVGIRLNQKDIPVDGSVRGVCGMLGLEPLYLACEGRLVVFAPKEKAEELVAVLRRGKYSSEAAVIGEVTEEYPGRVVIDTEIGGSTLLPPPGGELLPRIC